MGDIVSQNLNKEFIKERLKAFGWEIKDFGMKINGKEIAPKGAQVRHPGFDITPASNITMIITEKGVFKPNKISTLKKIK